jgi:hypothetical protein
LARDAKLLKAKKASMVKAKSDRASARKTALANAKKYHEEYEAADKALIDGRRDAKKKG